MFTDRVCKCRNIFRETIKTLHLNDRMILLRKVSLLLYLYLACGIHLDVLPKLFTKFATKSDTSGTGLGLFISKSIIEKHGGSIWAETDSDSKTCRDFEFTGSNEQVVDFFIPDIKSSTPAPAPKDFSLQDPSNLPEATVPESEPPPVPSLPPPVPSSLPP
jgi:hypothetical protein